MTEAIHTAQPLAVGLHAVLDVPVSIAALYVETDGAYYGTPGPHDITTTCGQAAYVCAVCGEVDYGDAGGPGDKDCEAHCRHRFDREYAKAKKRTDPLLAPLPHSWNARRYHQIMLRALRGQKKPRLP